MGKPIVEGDEIKPGARLRYLGDHIPFPKSTFLNRDAEDDEDEEGYWLPCFIQADGEIEWSKSPGRKSVVHTVVRVEFGRIGKRGQELPPLYGIKADYLGLWSIGLVAEDLVAKFEWCDDGPVLPKPEWPVDVEKAVKANPLWGAF